MLISIVIPVFNASKSLEELCSRIHNVFQQTINEEYEIILVNDGSRDDSWNIMKQLHSKNNSIKIIDLTKNSGQHSAIMCGLNNFSGEYVIMMDDDLQHYPEEIPKLLNEIIQDESLDVVIGVFPEKKHNMIRNIGSKSMQYLGRKIFHMEKGIKFTNFRILRAATASHIAKFSVHRPRIGQLILHTTRRIKTVQVKHDQRKYGKSGYTMIRLFKDFFLNIISNSSLPLRLISYTGLIISLISFFIGCIFLIKFIVHGTSVVGWTSLIVTITFFSGFILLSLGIIGEYLIRILTENYKFPNYLEREKHF
jgi:polyisoprenyl-phosphate glycosyltransferase